MNFQAYATGRRDLIAGVGIVSVISLAVVMQYGSAIPAIPFLVASIAGVSFFLYALRHPQALLYLLTLFIPFVGFSLFNVGETFGFDGTYFMMSVIVCVFIVRAVNGQLFLSGRLLATAGVLAIAAGLSGLAVINYDGFLLPQYGKSLLHILFYVLVFIAITAIDVDARTIRRVFAVAMGVSVFVSLYGIYQLFARNFDFPFATLDLTSSRQGVHVESILESYARISSFFSEPSWLGHYLLRIAVIVVVLLMRARDAGYSPLVRRCLAAVLLLTVATLFMSFSAGAIISGGIICLFMMLRERDFRGTLAGYIVTTLVLVLAVNTLIMLTTDINLAGIVAERLGGLVSGDYITGESVGQRVYEMETALALWKSSPLWGIGAGMTKVATGDLFWVSSLYPLVLAEQGVIGLAGLMIFAAALFALAHRAVKSAPRNTEAGVLATVLFYVLLTEFVSLATAGDLLSAKYWLDFGLVYAFSVHVLKKYAPAAGTAK